MTDTSVQQEPSIEEILASIRRIISEDGEADGAAAEGAEPSAEAAPEDAQPEAEVQPERDEPTTTDESDDVLELTERVDEPAPVPAPAAAEAPPPRRKPVQEPETPMPAAKSDYDDDALVSEQTAQRTTDVFSRLTPHESDCTDDPLPISTRTLEEVVRGMLRPMLREWLDTYLPGIVERSVERELRRMSRRAEDMH